MCLFKWIGNLFSSKESELFIGWIVSDLSDPYKSAPWRQTDIDDIDDESLFSGDSIRSIETDDLFEDDMGCLGLNPANDFPMTGCSLDIEGGLYGTDSIEDNLFGSNNGADLFNDSFSGCSDINPASGLPMIDDIGGIDVGGSPYGTDLSHDTFSSFDDSFGSSSFNDDW